MSVTNYWQTFQQNKCNHQGGAGHEPPSPMPPHFRALVSPLCNFRAVGCPASAGVVSCPWVWLKAVWAEAQLGTALCSPGTVLMQAGWWWTGAISTGPEQALSWWYTTKKQLLCSSELAAPAALTLRTLTWAVGDLGFRLPLGSAISTHGAASLPHLPSFSATLCLRQFPQQSSWQSPSPMFLPFLWAKESGQWHKYCLAVMTWIGWWEQDPREKARVGE